MSKAVVELRNVVKNYNLGKTEVKALRGISLEIERGNFVAIRGPSGCPKAPADRTGSTAAAP